MHYWRVVIRALRDPNSTPERVDMTPQRVNIVLQTPDIGVSDLPNGMVRPLDMGSTGCSHMSIMTYLANMHSGQHREHGGYVPYRVRARGHPLMETPICTYRLTCTTEGWWRVLYGLPTYTPISPSEWVIGSDP